MTLETLPKPKDSFGMKLFLYLFLTPFCVFGSLAVYKGISLLVHHDFKQGALMLVLGSAFSYLGFGLLWGIHFGSKRLTKEEKLQAEHPGKPWLWKEDWAQGRIRESGPLAAKSLWFFTILWNLVSLPIFFFLPQEFFEKKNYAALIGLVFPMAGARLIWMSSQATLRARRFGGCVLALKTVPVPVGGELRGTVEIPQGFPDGVNIAFQLNCVHRRESGSGKNRSTHESIQWQEELLVPAAQILHQGTARHAPIAIAIPLDAAGTRGQGSNDEIVWRLQGSAEIPGADFQVVFNVPVFETFDPAAPATPSPVTAARPAPVVPANPEIIAQLGPTGGMEYIFGRARHTGVAFGLTVFSLIWTGGIAFMIWKNAPFFFPLVFGFFALILWLMTWSLWFKKSVVRVQAGAINVKHDYLLWRSEREWTAKDLQDITLKIGMQSGGNVYYSLQAILANGRDRTLGEDIRSKREAEWLAVQMKKGLGLHLTPPSN